MPFLVPLILVLLVVLVLTGFMPLSLALMIGAGIIGLIVLAWVAFFGFVLWAANR